MIPCNSETLVSLLGTDSLLGNGVEKKDQGERQQMFYRSGIRQNSIFHEGILANPITSGTFSSAARPTDILVR